MTVQLPFPTSKHILFQFEGDFTQYPGLPSTEKREKTLTAITDGPPSLEVFASLREQYGSTHLVFPYSLSEVHGFRTFLPSTYYKVANSMPADLLQHGLDIGMKERMLQMQSELQTKISTIDAAVINSRRDMGTVISKVRQYLRLCGLFQQLGVRIHADPRDFGPYVPERSDEILMQVKAGMIGLFESVQWPLVPVPTQEFSVDLNASERQKFGYVDWLREKLGDNLDTVVAYGSSTQHDNPRQYNDFDNWVIVHDVPRAIRALRATKPHYNLSTGEVSDDEHGKHIGILLFPKAGHMLHDYIRFQHDVKEFLTTIKVLHGSLALPVPTEIEMVERGISQAYIKSKTLAGAVTLFSEQPEVLVGKQALFEFFCKNTRFCGKHAFKLGDPRVLTKEEVDDLLQKRFGIVIQPYRDDKEYIRDALLYSRIATARVMEQLLTGVGFDGSYFTDENPQLIGEPRQAELF